MHRQYSILDVASTSESLASVTRDAGTPREWLAQWPTACRSLISNLFHKAVRAGATTPALIVTAVHADLRRRLRYATPWLDATDATLHAVLQALQTAPQEAYPYAADVLAWEGLPRAERERQKRARAKPYRDTYMAGRPATEAQLRFLRGLGHTGAAPANRAQASWLIDELHNAHRGGRP
jgi:hypothetical protein